ncbi:MAG: hypothetical protein WKF96_02075 [Solirubrobacteraceae bacterium]
MATLVLDTGAWQAYVAANSSSRARPPWCPTVGIALRVNYTRCVERR